jgi:hypothetical protein
MKEGMVMTYKELNAAVMIATGMATAAWVLWQGRTNPVTDLESVAWRLLYAVGFNIIINIVVMIVATIVVSIVQREELKDERADERDRAIADKSMRNAYFAVSVGGLTVIIMLAAGFGPIAAAYSLFSVLVVGGLIDPISRLVYYRIG